MANKNEAGENPRFAIITPIGAIPRKEGIEISYLEVASDDEIRDRAEAEFIADKPGAWSTQDIDEKGNPVGKKSFHFSGAVWNAPWQPEGPPTPGGYVPPEKANPKEPIN